MATSIVYLASRNIDQVTALHDAWHQVNRGPEFAVTDYTFREVEYTDVYEGIDKLRALDTGQSEYPATYYVAFGSGVTNDAHRIPMVICAVEQNVGGAIRIIKQEAPYGTYDTIPTKERAMTAACAMILMKLRDT